MEAARPSFFDRWYTVPTLRGCRHAAANLAVSLMFVAGALPSTLRYGTRLADSIFVVGALATAVFVLLRPPPSASRVNLDALCAVVGMALMPALVDAAQPRIGAWYFFAATLELAGVTLSMSARVWMGRAFGILPANRGIVSGGPFRWVRHPIYAGWLILMAAYAMSYRGGCNALLAAAALPCAIWRIALEEHLLSTDPHYQRYREEVRFRLLPGVY